MNSIAVSEFELNEHLADEYYRWMTRRIFGNSLYVITSYKNRVYSTEIFLVKDTKTNKYLLLTGKTKKNERVFIWYRIINFFDEIRGK